MKTKVLLFFVFFSFVLLVQAQEKQEKYSYSNITEFGFVTASPQGVGFEGTIVNGFSIDKQHCLGIGIGFGGSVHTSYYEGTAYTPIFANYRVYFKPDRRFSPHINLSVGGVLVKDGEGVYSSLTAGFKSRKFSFSSGLSFMGLQRTEKYYGPGPYPGNLTKWYYPFGITIKCGFTF